MKPEYYINKFKNGEYDISDADRLAKQGWNFIMETGGELLDIVFEPDYMEGTA